MLVNNNDFLKKISRSKKMKGSVRECVKVLCGWLVLVFCSTDAMAGGWCSSSPTEYCIKITNSCAFEVKYMTVSISKSHMYSGSRVSAGGWKTLSPGSEVEHEARESGLRDLGELIYEENKDTGDPVLGALLDEDTICDPESIVITLPPWGGSHLVFNPYYNPKKGYAASMSVIRSIDGANYPNFCKSYDHDGQGVRERSWCKDTQEHLLKNPKCIRIAPEGLTMAGNGRDVEFCQKGW